jgi:hypothetical protein
VDVAFLRGVVAADGTAPSIWLAVGLLGTKFELLSVMREIASDVGLESEHSAWERIEDTVDGEFVPRLRGEDFTSLV